VTRWAGKPLKDVATIVRGVSFDKSQVSKDSAESSVPILRAGNINSSLDTHSDLVYVSPALVSESQLLRVGDIAICMSSGSSSVVGKTAQLRHEWLGSVGAFCAIIRFHPSINSRYGAYWLKSNQFLAWRDANAKGANIQNLRRAELEKLRIPLPPIAEQERIVKLLDEADALRKLRAQADQRTSQLIPALFHEMFGDPAGNPMGWKSMRLGEVGKLDRGRSKHRPRNEPCLYDGVYPFIQTGDIARSAGEITESSQTYSELGLAQSRMWPDGTLCITIAANIGKSAILTFPACFPDSVVGFVPGDMVVVSYVRQWLASVESRIEAAAPQMAQKNINLKILSGLEIPVPPLPLQAKFVERVTEIRELESVQAAAHRRLDDVFQTMLHRAFAGEL